MIITYLSGLSRLVFMKPVVLLVTFETARGGDTVAV